jgi:AraC-like DNA-binding protein
MIPGGQLRKTQQAVAFDPKPIPVRDEAPPPFALVRSPFSFEEMPSARWPINERAFEYYAPLRRVREYVEEHYADRITLKVAAKVAGLENKYFSTYFRKKVGIPFRYWLAAIRVRAALRLIASEDHSLTMVGEKVGFEDMRTFERCFKKCTGMTPREVKRLLAP